MSTIDDLHTDDTILAELGSRLASHRLRRNRTQSDLAHEAGISKRTLERLEAGHSAQLASFIRVLRALDLAENLNLLVSKPSPSPMELLQNQNRLRQRASSKRSREEKAPEPWTWGDED